MYACMEHSLGAGPAGPVQSSPLLVLPRAQSFGVAETFCSDNLQADQQQGQVLIRNISCLKYSQACVVQS